MQLDYFFIIYLMHMMVFGPLLIYVGYYHDTLHPSMYTLLIAMGVSALVYHGIKLVNRIRLGMMMI